MDLRKIDLEGQRVFKEFKKFAASLPMDIREANTKYQIVFTKLEDYEDDIEEAKRKIKVLENQARAINQFRIQLERNF